MTDTVFSFGELGFRNSKRPNTSLEFLKKRDSRFSATPGIPTSFIANVRCGKSPVIALGSTSTIFRRRRRSRALRGMEPMIEIVLSGARCGEGKNWPLVIIAALAVKKVMERASSRHDLALWFGVAKKSWPSSKAQLVAAGVFADVDVVIFTTSAITLPCLLGAVDAERAGVGRVFVQGRERACGGAPGGERAL